MRYTEEELLEAVDILVEEYGFDEDEAIDMINESLTIGSAYKGMSRMYNDTINKRDRYNNIKNNTDLHSSNEIKQARNNYYKSGAKALGVTALGVTAIGLAAKDARDKYPKLKAKLDRERRIKQRLKRMKRRFS